MPTWPNWKDLKKSAKVDPARVEEVRRGIEKGGRGLAARLAGPAAHLKNVGQEFKAGLTEPEPSATESAAPDQPPAAPATESIDSDPPPAH